MKKYILFSLFLIGLIAQPKVLVIVSSETEMLLKNGKVYKTGYYFNELTVPAMKLAEEGYELVIANPKGNPAQMDKRSDTVSYFASEEEYKKAKKFHASLAGLKNPKSLKAVIKDGLDNYDGVFFPGGHAPMIDLARSTEVGVILKHFHDHQKATALICHGPIALLGAVDNPQLFVVAMSKGETKLAREQAKNWPYRDYKMTIFSNAEEKVAEKNILNGSMLYLPQQGLEAAGGNVIVGDVWKSHVIQDRELITGQNPASDAKFVELFVATLKKQKKK